MAGKPSFHYGDREITPVLPIDERFKCKLCQKVMSEPIQTTRGSFYISPILVAMFCLAAAMTP